LDTTALSVVFSAVAHNTGDIVEIETVHCALATCKNASKLIKVPKTRMYFFLKMITGYY